MQLSAIKMQRAAAILGHLTAAHDADPTLTMRASAAVGLNDDDVVGLLSFVLLHCILVLITCTQVIVSAVRTPIARAKKGGFNNVPADHLLSTGLNL